MGNDQLAEGSWQEIVGRSKLTGRGELVEVKWQGEVVRGQLARVIRQGSIGKDILARIIWQR